MTGKDSQLRKENQQLRNEVAELKKHLEKLSVEIDNRTEESDRAAASHGSDSSPESKAKSVEFVSAQYDEFQAFRKYASEEIKKMKLKLNSISDAYDRLSKSIDSFETYSYQFNFKITGLPLVAERESSEQTANLCLQLFRQIGVKEISINGIDIAHRVPAIKPSNQPNAVICEFCTSTGGREDEDSQEGSEKHRHTTVGILVRNRCDEPKHLRSPNTTPANLLFEAKKLKKMPKISSFVG